MKKEPADITTLKNLKKAMEASDIQNEVISSQIKNPSEEVEYALTDFLTNKLEKLSRDDEFSDLIKMHIRQRLPEASFEELIKLSHDMNMDHTKSMGTVLELFKNETSGKNIIDNLKENSISSTAQQLYDSTDNKDILQAVNYLSQVVGKLQAQPAIVIEENKK